MLFAAVAAVSKHLSVISPPSLWTLISVLLCDFLRQTEKQSADWGLICV